MHVEETGDNELVCRIAHLDGFIIDICTDRYDSAFGDGDISDRIQVYGRVDNPTALDNEVIGGCEGMGSASEHHSRSGSSSANELATVNHCVCF